MGQFSMEKLPLPGSALSGNQHAVFLGIIHLVACLHNLRVTARIGSLEDLSNFGHRP